MFNVRNFDILTFSWSPKKCGAAKINKGPIHQNVTLGWNLRALNGGTTRLAQTVNFSTNLVTKSKHFRGQNEPKRTGINKRKWSSEIKWGYGTYRYFSPNAGLGCRIFFVCTKNAFRVHNQDPVGGQSINFMVRPLPLGRLFTQKNISGWIESGGEYWSTTFISVCQNSEIETSYIFQVTFGFCFCFCLRNRMLLTMDFV